MRQILFPGLLLFITISVSQLAWSECPHCYTVAKVRLVLRSGESKVGYSPIYEGDYIKSDSDKTGIDLKRKFNKAATSINFVKNCYSFPEVGPLVAKEDIESINLKDVSQLILLDWTDFSGALTINNLPRAQIEKIRKMGIVKTRVVFNQGADECYINIDKTISEKELELLLRYQGGDIAADENKFNTLYDPFGYISGAKPIKGMEDQLAILTRLEVERKRDEVELTAFQCESTNTIVANYFQDIRDQFNKRLHFYSALAAFVKSDNKMPLKRFAEHEIEDPEIRTLLDTAVFQAGMDETKLAVDTKKIIQSLKWYLYIETEAVFKKLIEDNVIFVLEQGWD